MLKVALIADDFFRPVLQFDPFAQQLALMTDFIFGLLDVMDAQARECVTILLL